MDLLAVYEAMQNAANFVRTNSCPMLLEMKIYRYRGHSMSDPAKYRSKEEVEHYKQIDPILKLKGDILNNNYATLEELKDIERSIKEIVSEAEAFAHDSEFPGNSELYTNVYLTNMKTT